MLTLCHRIPLVRKKSLRKTLLDHGLLGDFLKNHSPNPASKYFPQEAPVMATQPLENYMDVSAQAGPRGQRCSQGSWMVGRAPRQEPRAPRQDLRGTGHAGKLTVRAAALAGSVIHSSSVYASCYSV